MPANSAVRTRLERVTVPRIPSRALLLHETKRPRLSIRDVQARVSYTPSVDTNPAQNVTFMIELFQAASLCQFR